MQQHRALTQGFTLVELLIVVSVIAILSGMAIPNLLTSRMAANEQAAIQAERLISKGMEGYRIANRGGDNGYPDDFKKLAGLVPPDIDPILATGTRSGYTFSGGGDKTTWSVTAVPVSYRKSGMRSFYVDETGVIRYADKGGVPATASDPPLD